MARVRPDGGQGRAGVGAVEEVLAVELVDEDEDVVDADGEDEEGEEEAGGAEAPGGE